MPASGVTPSLPWRPLYARYSARSCRSANNRYPPKCDVHRHDPQRVLHVDTGQADWVLTQERADQDPVGRGRPVGNGVHGDRAHE